MSDDTLVQRVRNGDQEAYELLVKLHFKSVYHMAFRYMKDHAAADDVVQDSFVKAFRSLHLFRGDSSFKSWIMRIAINTAKNSLRSKGRRPESQLDKQIIASHHQGFKRLEREQSLEILRAAIEELPTKQRQTIELRIFEEMTFKEVAVAMDCPFNTAKANFRHGLENLRKLLSEVENGKGLAELRLLFEGWNKEEGTHL